MDELDAPQAGLWVTENGRVGHVLDPDRGDVSGSVAACGVQSGTFRLSPPIKPCRDCIRAGLDTG